VGTFCQPRFVLEDPSLLATLPRWELTRGAAEVIKHAAIADRALFEFLQADIARVLNLDREALDRVVGDSVRIKAAVVEADETERGGERIKLNFGHTIGHALERAAGLPHGEAVGLGMIAAARISARRGLLPNNEAQALNALIARAGLPTRVEADLDAVLDAIGKDKKRQEQSIRFILLKGLGQAVVAEVERDEINAVCRELVD
jgi:3-dehydroquinate synthase